MVVVGHQKSNLALIINVKEIAMKMKNRALLGILANRTNHSEIQLTE